MKPRATRAVSRTTKPLQPKDCEGVFIKIGLNIWYNLNMKKIVITGGPSVGKTTVIEILASRFYSIIPEAATMIIKEEKTKNSDALPWKNVAKFQNLVVQRQIESEAKARGDIVFYDRGIVDGYAYCKVSNAQVPQFILDNARGRYDQVFFLDPLGFYVENGIRSRMFEDEVKIHKAIKEAYVEFGYDPITVPVLPPEKRVDYILSLIK